MVQKSNPNSRVPLLIVVGKLIYGVPPPSLLDNSHYSFIHFFLAFVFILRSAVDKSPLNLVNNLDFLWPVLHCIARQENPNNKWLMFFIT